jgi:hypothetical protein
MNEHRRRRRPPGFSGTSHGNGASQVSIPTHSHLIASRAMSSPAAPARYVLHYWPIKARAYLPGVIAAHGGLGMQLVPTDEPSGVTFDSIESQMPFGQLPMLAVDGQTHIGQSNAITRFLVCGGSI